jgi:Leucine-rich repeat (LRR) protein
MDNLIKKFDELTSLRSFPKLFIHEYFFNLKCEVDLYFALIQDKQKDYIEMISVIEKIEHLAYMNLTKKTLNICDEDISIIKNLIEKNELNNLISYQIDSIKYTIEEILLSKRSIHFFKGPFLVVLNDVYLRKFFKDSKAHNIFDKNDLNLFQMYEKLENLKKTNIIYLNLLCDKTINICYDEDKHKDLIEYQDLFGNYDADIERHDITYIFPNTFDGFANLTTLEFTKSQIFFIDPNMFHKLINLKKIDFSGNKIEKLHPETFKGLMSLLTIDFSANSLTELDPDLFNGLNSVYKLNFNFNSIKEIDQQLFKDLESVQEILFECNCLKMLDVNTFYGLKMVRRVNFSFNEFNYLDANVFNGLEYLQEIDFSYNKIQNYSDFKDSTKYCVEF